MAVAAASTKEKTEQADSIADEGGAPMRWTKQVGDGHDAEQARRMIRWTQVVTASAF